MYDIISSIPKERQEENVMNRNSNSVFLKLLYLVHMAKWKQNYNRTFIRKTSFHLQGGQGSNKKGSKFPKLYDFFMRKKDNILAQPLFFNEHNQFSCIMSISDQRP